MDSLNTILQHNYTNTRDSVNNNKTTNTKTLAEVQQIASKLEDCLGKQIPSRYEYYCKVAWNLPEHVIWLSLESAMKGRSPQRLFSYLTTLQMKKAL